MLLALDAGNTNITIGAFEDGLLIGRWRLRTVLAQTADEWGILLRNLFSLASLDLSTVHGIIISSVVPPLDSSLARMASFFGVILLVSIIGISIWIVMAAVGKKWSSWQE